MRKDLECCMEELKDTILPGKYLHLHGENETNVLGGAILSTCSGVVAPLPSALCLRTPTRALLPVITSHLALGGRPLLLQS